VLAVALSVGSIYASDVNVTDSYACDADDSSVAIIEEQSDLSASESGVDNDSPNDILESVDSSTLSTNTDDGDVLAIDGNATSNIDASKTVTAKDVTKYYKGSTKYTATFLDNSGSALANTKVKISVNGKDYTKTTDSKGIASLDINLKPGTYKVTATNPASGYKLTTSFKVLSTISANDVSKVYKDSRSFTATFLRSDGKALANQKVKFKVNGKTYTKKTDSKGQASISLKSLKPGTHKIISYNKDGLTKTNKVKVAKTSSTKITASSYTFLKSETKKVKARLLDQYGHALGKGHVIKFTIKGKKYSAKTNKKGYATLKLPSLKEGVYTVKYSFAKSGNYKASSTSSKVTVIPSKTPTFTVKSTKTFGHGAGTSFKVALKSGSVPLASQTVKLTVDGKSYTKTTDSEGTVSLPINLEIGNYTISYQNTATSKINAKKDSTKISVIKRAESSVNWKTSTSFKQGVHSCQVQVLDSNNKPISGATVKMTVDSKSYSAKTSSNGYATISAIFPDGKYEVSYTFTGNNLNAPSTKSTSLNVEKVTKVSLKSIVTAASSLKSYIESNGKLPGSVMVSGIPFTVPEFEYMMSQAICEIANSKTGDIAYIDGVANPTSPSGNTINANLKQSDYLTVAKNVASFISQNRRAPNFSASSLGKIIYDEVVDAESRILSFYASNNRLPSYVKISTSTASQSGTGLNEKNTISDLTPYLKATTHCEVDSDAIKKIVKSVTKGLTSTSAKAKAIFNYVRDTISYSFYYDTKYGAVKTLSAKTGNCVDHTHLLVAMFRTADIPARYVHGTCRFTSGSTYGHVWAQVLIDGKWTIADATSSRNSLGNVANWNTKSFTLKGIYSSISF
jgi:hypothetical protein